MQQIRLLTDFFLLFTLKINDAFYLVALINSQPVVAAGI